MARWLAHGNDWASVQAEVPLRCDLSQMLDVPSWPQVVILLLQLHACDNAPGGVGQTVASFATISVEAGAEESPGSTGHGTR